MNVVLIQPSDSDKAMIHLGLAYVAAALERRGDRVKVIDAGLLDGAETKIAKLIEESNPDVVGITAQTPYYGKALSISRLVKRLNPRCPVVFGGAHPSILTEETLEEPSIDIVVRGEGDVTVGELLACLEDSGSLERVKGISFKRDGRIIHNPDRPFVDELDSLPFPAWHLFEMERYRARINGRRVAPVLSSRGCPFKCIFCYRGPAAGKLFRGRSPEKIVEEIESLHTRYGVSDILFVDDIFTINKRRAERVCDLLIERQTPVSWRCQTRADCLSPDLLRKMKAANCIDVSMGVESGNEQILKATGKKLTKDGIRDAFRMIREAGLSSSASFIIGLPGDTRETVQETIRFAKELNPNFAIFYAAMPYPGTELARMVVENGGALPRTWESYRLMSSDVASSKLLSDLRISNLTERELRYFLRTAQIEFQMGRLLGHGEARAKGVRNMLQVVRLAYARRKSWSHVLRFAARVLADSSVFFWSRLRGRQPWRGARVRTK